MEQREHALRAIYSLLHLPYIWGGDNPNEGFDCSGFVIEVLKSAAALPRKGDWTADDLHDIFPSANEVLPGCLIFYDWNGNNTMDHVEIVVEKLADGRILTAGASGGSSETTSQEQALKDDGYIKIRTARTDWAEITDPFKSNKA